MKLPDAYLNKKNGRPKAGKHRVKLTAAARTAYIPVPVEGVKEREGMIA